MPPTHSAARRLQPRYIPYFSGFSFSVNRNGTVDDYNEDHSRDLHWLTLNLRAPELKLSIMN
jgi:hypothetical protein